ncbi:hypothetical protein [Microvirga aerilata]|uniref:hypothetical protein n=1 Tax=Microvirga aerilata TaxID=670292 RepID=UPI003612291A
MRFWINAAVIQKVVKADPNFADVAGWVGRCSKADKDIHFAYEAFSLVSQSELDLAMSHPRFEVVEKEQDLSIHVHVDAAKALPIRAGRDLNAFQQVGELCRPFNDGVLCQRHWQHDP